MMGDFARNQQPAMPPEIGRRDDEYNRFPHGDTVAARGLSSGAAVAALSANLAKEA